MQLKVFDTIAFKQKCQLIPAPSMKGLFFFVTYDCKLRVFMFCTTGCPKEVVTLSRFCFCLPASLPITRCSFYVSALSKISES